MHTNQQVRAHFSNISLLNFLPQFHRSPARYDEELLKFIPEKYSYAKYHSKTRKPTPPSQLTTEESQTQSTSSMDGNVSTSQDSNPTLTQDSIINDFEDIATDFDSIPAQPKDTIIMPSILKQADTNTVQKDVIIVPQLLKPDKPTQVANIEGFSTVH